MVYKNELIIVPRHAQELIRVILYDLIHKLLRFIAEICQLNLNLSLLAIADLQEVQACKWAHRDLVWLSSRLNTEYMANHVDLHRADDLDALTSCT
jgi:hypothetical protein